MGTEHMFIGSEMFMTCGEAPMALKAELRDCWGAWSPSEEEGER